jgi:hypothetical protein
MVCHPVVRTRKVKDEDTGEVREEVTVQREGLARSYIN